MRKLEWKKADDVSEGYEVAKVSMLYFSASPDGELWVGRGISHANIKDYASKSDAKKGAQRIVDSIIKWGEK